MNANNNKDLLHKALMEYIYHPLNIKNELGSSENVFLGEADIHPQISFKLDNQGESNLLVSGQDEIIGLRVMCSSIISIAAHQQSKSCKFYSFNFYNVDSKFINIPYELCNSIGHDCVNINNRQINERPQEIKLEIENRSTELTLNNSNFYLCFFSFQRGYVFRKEDFDINEEVKLLEFILTKGPRFGVHGLLQIDSMISFERKRRLKTLELFSHRVASQMSVEN